MKIRSNPPPPHQIALPKKQHLFLEWNHESAYPLELICTISGNIVFKNQIVFTFENLKQIGKNQFAFIWVTKMKYIKIH